MNAQRPTLEEVARLAKVSRATASRVANGSVTVKPDLVSRVNAAIDQLGYVPNHAARSLAAHSSGSVALLIPEDLTRFFADPFFATLLHGITQRVDESGFLLNLLVSSATEGGPVGKVSRYLQGGNADGVLVVSHHAGDAGVEELANILPAVYGGKPDVVFPGRTHYVDVDNMHGGRCATRRLLETGHVRIATISGPLSMAAGRDRLEGFLTELAAAGREPAVVATGDFTRESGALAMNDILATGKPFDSVFAASDLMAQGAISVLRRQGVRVPGDVAVIGFDDSAAALQGDVQLTTIRQPSIQLGWAMADMLFSLLNGEAQPEVLYLDTELVIRESA